MRFNQYLVEQKVSAKDDIDWKQFPLSKYFYKVNCNVHREKRKNEGDMWKVIKDRNEKGQKICKLLPEDRREALIKAFKALE